MKALFFILYAYLFIRGIVLLFKKPKQGTSKMQAHKKQRMFKLSKSRSLQLNNKH